MSYRIVVCIDVEAENAEEAYGLVHDALNALPEAFAWESSDEWYDNDGEEISEERCSEARMAFFEKRSIASEADSQR